MSLLLRTTFPPTSILIFPWCWHIHLHIREHGRIGGGGERKLHNVDPLIPVRSVISLPIRATTTTFGTRYVYNYALFNNS